MKQTKTESLAQECARTHRDKNWRAENVGLHAHEKKKGHRVTQWNVGQLVSRRGGGCISRIKDIKGGEEGGWWWE